MQLRDGYFDATQNIREVVVRFDRGFDHLGIWAAIPTTMRSFQTVLKVVAGVVGVVKDSSRINQP
jgi:hypothetical protein